MPDPAEVGERVLAGLAAGRQRAIAEARERAAPTWRAVRRELDHDVLGGHPPRGRAGRIALELRSDGVAISERQVRRILAALFSESDPVRHYGAIDNTEA